MSNTQRGSNIAVGSHAKTSVPVTNYMFKWTVDNFSGLPLDTNVRTSIFFPLSDSPWYCYLIKSLSSLLWTIYNEKGTEVKVLHRASITDTSGHIWYENHITTYYNANTTYAYLKKGEDSILIQNLNALDLTGQMVTFVCDMKIFGNGVKTSLSEIDSRNPNDHLKKLSKDFKIMYETSLHTDLCMKVGDNVLRAHKAVLRSRSPVFAKMFEHKMNEEDTNSIDIEDLELPALKDLLTFLYTGVVPDGNVDSLKDLYYAADKYDVEDLRDACGDILSTKLDVDNVCRLLIDADRHSDRRLKTAVLKFIEIHLDSLITTDAWKDLVIAETKLAAEVMCLRAVQKKAET